VTETDGEIIGEKIDRSVSFQGGDLGRTGGTFPPELEVGGRPMHTSPNIFRSSVVGCAGKYEQGLKKGVFIARKGSYTTFTISHSTNTEHLGRKRGNTKNQVDEFKERS